MALSTYSLLDDDTLLFFNYRSDRVREVTQLLGDIDRSPTPDFPYPKNLHITTMTQYKTDYPFRIAFPPQHMGNVLAEWLSKKGLEQCHVAETEKYAHVTFFFNGGVEKHFPGEDREMIPSPKVATYDKDPKMSAAGVADRLCERIVDGRYDFLMNNFAPPDMVGHTGVYKAAIQGVTATDVAIGKVLEKCREQSYLLFVTADHGYKLPPILSNSQLTTLVMLRKCSMRRANQKHPTRQTRSRSSWQMPLKAGLFADEMVSWAMSHRLFWTPWAWTPRTKWEEQACWREVRRPCSRQALHGRYTSVLPPSLLAQAPHEISPSGNASSLESDALVLMCRPCFGLAIYNLAYQVSFNLCRVRRGKAPPSLGSLPSFAIP